MKKTKIFAALALSACMAFGSTGLIACSPANSGSNSNGGDSGYTQDTVDPIMEVYKAYVTSAQANGEEPMSYEEWYADLLANAKGEKGDKGDDGEQGEKGETGEKGADGNTWLVGTTAPTAEDGKDGDLYLDYTTWNVYHKENGAWVLLGNIKGEKGDNGEDGVGGGSQDETEGFEVTIQADRAIGMPISDVSEGVHIIEISLGSTKLTTGSIQAQIGSGAISDVVYSESRSTEDNNVYYGYLVVPADATQVKLSAIGEDVNGTVVIKDWEMPTLKADGQPVEIPMNLYNSQNVVDESAIKAKLDSSVTAGSYIFSTSGISSITHRLWIGSTRKSVTASNFSAYSLSIADTDLNSSGDTLVYLAYAATNGTSITPVTVTLTVKAS